MAADNARRLAGWKEVAEYLGTSARTAQRWEQEKGLPVQRVPGSRGHMVFAEPGELDGWLASDGPHRTTFAPAPVATARERSTLEASGFRLIDAQTPLQPPRPASHALRYTVLVAMAAALVLAGGLLRAKSSGRRATLSARTLTGAPTPMVTSVSAIEPTADQVIVITGRGFGTHTYFANADTPFLAIRDNTARWAAGRMTPENWDEVTLNVALWTDSQIVATGFAGAYGQHWWKLNPGDKIEVAVWNPQTRSGPGTYELSVASPRPVQK